jgi:RsiW-degrading membrane proteinase PrsW (M82 family)
VGNKYLYIKLFVCFLGGFLVSFPIYLFQYYSRELLNGEICSTFVKCSTFVTIEELLLVFIALIFALPNNIKTLPILGVSSALGFSLVEHLAWFSNNNDISRNLLRLLQADIIHIVSTGLICLFIYWGIRWGRMWLMLLGFLLGIGIHTSFNYAVEVLDFNKIYLFTIPLGIAFLVLLYKQVNMHTS